MRQDGYLNRWFLDPLFRGAYPEDMVDLYEGFFGPFDAVRDGDLELISQPVDFLGVNYYNPMRVAMNPGDLPLQVEMLPGRGELTHMGWEVDPDGLREVLVRIRDEYRDLPIYITENGAAYDDADPVEDPERTAYLSGHLEALRAAAAGASTSSATACGRCWTTSSGSRATTSASASCTSTSPPSSAR